MKKWDRGVKKMEGGLLLGRKFLPVPKDTATARTPHRKVRTLLGALIP